MACQFFELYKFKHSTTPGLYNYVYLHSNCTVTVTYLLANALMPMHLDPMQRDKRPLTS